MSQTLERIARIETMLEDNNKSIHRIEQAVFGNGKYYGGGIKGAPSADPYDGLLDLVYIQKVSVLRFLSLVSQFIKGNHLSDKRCEPYVKNCRCKTLLVILRRWAGAKNTTVRPRCF